MSSCRSLASLALAGLALGAAAEPRYPGIGRAATPAELAAWDIDVRPDFKGLPKGAGSVAQGQQLWEEKCAGCHGVFGESNEVFAPLVGGTTADDIARGRVAALRDPAYPQRTAMMKLATLSTLWDYIRRAMPWTAPKSLSVDEVYAVTAYMLHLAGVLPADGELSEANIAQVQRRLPNRDGMTSGHAMWPGSARKPDVQGSPCMRDCAPEPAVASMLPDHARDAHGNLAAQQRTVGPQRGVDTGRAVAAAAPAAAQSIDALLRKNVCVACHQVDGKLVGPSFRDVAAKYAGRGDAAQYLTGRIRAGGVGVWGAVPMPPQALSEADAQAIAAWLAAGARP
jgi:cytochrome c